jgi:hypothetical protein
MERRCYRVWMRDGFVCSCTEYSAEAARAHAVSLAEASCKGLVMSARDRRWALTVVHVEDIDYESQQ